MKRSVFEKVLQKIKAPKTQPSSVPEKSIEEVEEESVGKKTYVPGTVSNYVEVSDELQDTTGKTKKESIFGNIDLQSVSLSLKEATTIHMGMECTPDSNLVPKPDKALVTHKKKK